jgi:ATP-dependent helicase HrpB
MPPPRPVLPIDAVLDDLVGALRRGPAVVLQAPPGAGKTTRVPLAVLDAGLVPPGQQILLLEPRRVAARAAASTMARSVGDGVGGTVGYQVRFDKRASTSTKILVVTEGILTRRFADDALLEGTGVVILDEFHERSVHTDLCLALVRELQQVRDDLKLVVMSATLDAAAVAAFLHDCPVVTSAGRPFPVAIRHVEKKARDGERPLDERVAGAIRTLMATTEPGFADDGGDVLCFLPGAPEIERVRQRLSERALPDDADVVALFGAMSPAEQDRALLPGPRRKVILATNVAETSLTIEGVTTVVDSGLQKTVRWDSGSDRERLELTSISKASAEQRAGRAGRTRPGRALRLWSEAEHAQLLASHAPEIHRVELSRILLDIAVFSGEDPRRFAFFEPPPPTHLDHAVDVLQLLGALDATGRPTARGRALARLPLSPRAAAVMLAARDLDVVDDAAWAMALLEDDRALSAVMERQATTTTDSDLQEHIARAEHDRRLSELRQSVKALTALVGAPPRTTHGEGPGRRLKRALLAGFPDRVCRRRKAGAAEALMVGGRGVKLLPGSGVDADLFLALSLEGRGPAAGVAIAEAVDEALLEEAAPDLLSTSTEAVLDEARGAFVGVRRSRFADLIIDERDGVSVDDDAVARGLAAAFAERFDRLFAPDDAARSLLERLRFARLALPDDDFPAVDDDDLKALLPDLCAELVRKGRRRLEDVAAADWRGAIAGLLDWPHQQLLDAEVPAKLRVPTGNALRVDYAPALRGAAPVLAVRLQECFGWLDTPRVARGRVAVVLHLLSPGYKPVQVTTDLRSFWQRGYKEVRAELRARYPKHSWPDDPLSAAPVAKGRSSR